MTLSTKSYKFLLLNVISIMMLMVCFRQNGVADPAFTILTEYTIKVSSPDQVAEAAIRKAEALGGYFKTSSTERLILLIPKKQLNAFTSFVMTKGVVVEKTYEAVDISDELAKMKTGVKAKEEMMIRYLEALRKSKQRSIVAVEKEVVGLGRDIDLLKGKIRLLEHTVTYDTVTLNFRFHDRTPPEPSGRSSFVWLNSLSLQNMIRDFYYGN